MKPDTLFALYSTIYFQSKWSTEFLPDSNTQGLFYGDFPSMVTYMNENLAQMYYFWDPDFSAVYRTLRNGSTMWFILPDPGKTAEDILMSGRFLELATAGFGPEAWPNQKYVRVNLSIPKFDISGRINLRSELQSLGITHAFDPKQASFPSVGGGFLTDVSQAARVAIDENGVVAAAYTEFLCGSAMPPEEILDFRLDRPFLFVIVKEQIPLFVGIVASPQ
jgi:serpin B